MAYIRINTNKGVTFEDLLKFVEECKENNIPNNTPVKMSQHVFEVLSDVMDIHADEESIIFYDWI